jgi:hypothetical protein
MVEMMRSVATLRAIRVDAVGVLGDVLTDHDAQEPYFLVDSRGRTRGLAAALASPARHGPGSRSTTPRGLIIPVDLRFRGIGVTIDTGDHRAVRRLILPRRRLPVLRVLVGCVSSLPDTYRVEPGDSGGENAIIDLSEAVGIRPRR